MVQVNFQDDRGVKFWVDEPLVKKVENIKMMLKKNWDCVILVDGRERSGKSTLGLTIAKLLDPNLNVKNLARGTMDCIKKIEALPDKSVMVIDEGSLALSSGDAQRSENRRLLKILDVVGQKNMVFIIVLPSIFDLQKQIAVRRARFLLHVYTSADLRRGRYGYYSEKQLPKLYFEGKKKNNTYTQEATWYGRFDDYNPLGEDYFGVKKETLIEALHDGEDALGKREQKNLERLRAILHYIIKEKKFINQKELAHVLKEKYEIDLSNKMISYIMGGVLIPRSKNQ